MLKWMLYRIKPIRSDWFINANDMAMHMAENKMLEVAGINNADNHIVVELTEGSTVTNARNWYKTYWELLLKGLEASHGE